MRSLCIARCETFAALGPPAPLFRGGKQKIPSISRTSVLACHYDVKRGRLTYSWDLVVMVRQAYHERFCKYIPLF